MTPARLDALLREAHASGCAVVMVPDARRVELVPWPDDEPPPWTVETRAGERTSKDGCAS